jgi:glycosyltransferase involved in cell wall biosynthesis
MRVAYLINDYPKVSHTFIRREMLALERQGVEVMRVALRGWDSELASPEDQRERRQTRYVLRDGALPLLFATMRMLVTRPMRFLRTLRLACSMSRGAERPLPIHLIYLAEACRISSWLQTADVQHVHAHFGTNSAEVAMLMHELGGPPWSFTVHGPEEFDKASGIGLAEKVRRAAFVVAISSFGRSQLYRLTPWEHWQKLKVVPCGVEAKYFGVTIPSPTMRRLVCVGRLCEQKGQMLLLEAARLLAERGVIYELVLAGDGEMRGAIEAQIARYGLGNQVRITGWISSDAVRDELLRARALVLPSFAEGLPVVIMEAMALRRPVISTYVAGIPELVRPGEHGWLLPAGDISALVEAMQACLDAPVSVISKMGEAAHAAVLPRHDVDKVATALVRLMTG